MAVRAIGYPTFTSPPGQFLRKEIPVRKNQGGAVAVVTVYNDHRLGLYFFELSPLPNFWGLFRPSLAISRCVVVQGRHPGYT